MSDNLTSPPVTPPDDLVYPASPASVEALEFIGLTQVTAQRIFDNLKSAQIKEEIKEKHLAAELPSFIRGHLTQLHKLDDLPTADAFTRVGLTADTIAAILDPEFQEIFETNTPFYWAYDTLRMRFNHVLLVDERIKKSAENAVLAKKQKKRPKVEDLFSGNETLESVPTTPENHLMLFIGMCPAEFKIPEGTAITLEDTEFIREDGSINLELIWSYAGGDFNAHSLAWYFTTEHETADLYRGYAARRNKHQETWIIRIAIPLELAATLHTEKLWWSPDFREFVWHCRKSKLTLPEKFHQYTSSDIIEGHILKDPKIIKCDKSKIHTNITEDKLCKLDSGRKATQWVVMNGKTAEKIAEWSRGKVYIEVFAPEIHREGS